MSVSDVTLSKLGVHSTWEFVKDPHKPEVYIQPDVLPNMASTWTTEVVFVTGASEDHFTESFDLIGSIHTYFPGCKIYFYDLGLAKGHRTEVKSWCNVQLRDVNYNKYPAHVRNLFTYSFKPLLLHEVLTSHRVAFWVDSSVRITRDTSESLFSAAVNSSGLVQALTQSLGNSIYAVTHPKMFRYLVHDVIRLKTIDIIAAGALLVFKTRTVYERVVYWWVLCGLDPSCISPTDKLICPGGLIHRSYDYRHLYWLGCHRYDQSSLNIITDHVYGGERPYIPRAAGLEAIRKPSTNFQVTDLKCPSGHVHSQQTVLPKDIE